MGRKKPKQPKPSKQVEGSTPVATEAPEDAETDEDEDDGEGTEGALEDGADGAHNDEGLDEGAVTKALEGVEPDPGKAFDTSDLAPTFEGGAVPEPERKDPEVDGDNAGIPREGEAHAEVIAATVADAELVAKDPDAVEELPHRDPRCDANGRHIVNCDCTGSAREPL